MNPRRQFNVFITCITIAAIAGCLLAYFSSRASTHLPGQVDYDKKQYFFERMHANEYMAVMVVSGTLAIGFLLASIRARHRRTAQKNGNETPAA